MTTKQIQRLQRNYDAEMETAGLMTGRKLQKIIASSNDLQMVIKRMISPEKENTKPNASKTERKEPL